jgi:protein-tyrosine phosphatase
MNEDLIMKQLNCFKDEKKPSNYREMSFDLRLEQMVNVVGLARPDYGQGSKKTMHYLKNHQVQTIFGLDVLPEFASIAKEQGMDYVDVSIPDFTAPSLEIFEVIYEKILELAKIGQKVAIHCRGGIGRTGTVLAAIKLKELSMSKSFKELNFQLNSTVEVYHKEVQCTQSVKDAIMAVRTMEGSEYAIEVQEQVDALCSYEHLLRCRASHRNDEAPTAGTDSLQL